MGVQFNSDPAVQLTDAQESGLDMNTNNAGLVLETLDLMGRTDTQYGFNGEMPAREFLAVMTARFPDGHPMPYLNMRLTAITVLCLKATNADPDAVLFWT